MFGATTSPARAQDVRLVSSVGTLGGQTGGPAGGDIVLLSSAGGLATRPASDGTADVRVGFVAQVVAVGGGPRIVAADAAESAPPPTLALGVPTPHPVRGTAWIVLSLPDDVPVTVDVLDALGRRAVRVVSSRLGAGHHRLGIDAGGLAPGLYVVLARTGSGSARRAFVVY